MDMIKCIKKEYATQSTVPLEDSVGYMIKHELTNMDLKISQLHLITKVTRIFNKDTK